MSLFEKNAIDISMLNLKLNFTHYISRFEREHGYITEYNTGATLTTRINKITEILKQYAKEQ